MALACRSWHRGRRHPAAPIPPRLELLAALLEHQRGQFPPPDGAAAGHLRRLCGKCGASGRTAWLFSALSHGADLRAASTYRTRPNTARLLRRCAPSWPARCKRMIYLARSCSRSSRKKRKRGSRWQPSPPCRRATKPMKVSLSASRRTNKPSFTENRPTIGV